MSKASRVLNEGKVPRASLILELLSASSSVIIPDESVTEDDGTATVAPPEHAAETPEEREARHKKERDEQDQKDMEHEQRMKDIESGTDAAMKKKQHKWWQGDF